MSNQKNFSTDPIENYLLSLGVSKTTIEANKIDIAKSASEYLYFYDSIPDKKAKDVLIPLEKVKGIKRVSGYSWLDIFRSLRTAATTIKGMETIRGIYKKNRKEGTLFGFSVCLEIKGLLGITA